MAKKNIEQAELKKESYNKLHYSKLRWKCPVDIFNFESTEELDSLEEIIGQDRAIEAIKLGARLKAKGYNIFVTGLSGTGRLSTVQKILDDIKPQPCEIYDYCYVNNFKNENEPTLIKLGKGQASHFAEQMRDLVAFFRRRIPKLFEEEAFQAGKRKIIEEYQENEKAIYSSFDEKVQQLGFIRAQFENEQGVAQMDIFPVVDSQPVHIDDLQTVIVQGKITAEKAEEFKKNYIKLRNELYELGRSSFKSMQEFRKALSNYDKEASHQEIFLPVDQIKKQYSSDNENIHKYLDNVQEFIINHINIFLDNQQQTDENMEIIDDSFRIFSVNIVLDNSNTQTSPVIIETTPSYSNLFGSIERVYDKKSGYWRTDFTKINAGALLKADQGFLIVNCEDLFTEPGAWTALKRVLLYDKLEIMNYDNYFQFSQATLKPEAINVNVKVVIIGGESIYQMLYHYEKGFKKIFKIHAQFAHDTLLNDEILMNYARFLKKISYEENLPYCSPDGTAAIIEWAVSAAESQKRITLSFSDVADVLREAAIIAQNYEKKLINHETVEAAIKNRAWRNNLLDERIRQNIEEGYMLIDTVGERIGQINALTVYNNGINSFGKPARITATISPGNNGIINIEREADMSGNIHNKAILIISSFLREKFSSAGALSFTASIAFEQSYGGIDGDSASMAEIYILLSALAQVPIKQCFAITGSVNQKGDIQPIGGVNEKITGFFEICRDRGLTGEQGVIIPYQNEKDLMLNAEIIEAVKNNLFSICSVSTIEEGAEILMNIPIGDKNENGEYPKDTLYFKAIERIKELNELAENNPKKSKPRKK